MVKGGVFKVVFIMLLAALMPGCGISQESSGDKFNKMKANTTPAERAAFQTEMMTGALALDEKQIEKIGAVNLAYAEQVDDIRKSVDSRRKKFRKVWELQEEKDREIKAVLTGAQYEKYLINKEEMRARPKEKRRKKL